MFFFAFQTKAFRRRDYDIYEIRRFNFIEPHSGSGDKVLKTQPVFTCSKLTIETLEQDVKQALCTLFHIEGAQIFEKRATSRPFEGT